MSVDFLHILETVGVQARIDQLSEVHTFFNKHQTNSVHLKQENTFE